MMLCDRCGPAIGEHLPDPGDECGLCGAVFEAFMVTYTDDDGPEAKGLIENWRHKTALEVMKEALDGVQHLLPEL
jgi:hypothetical protein